MAVPVPLSPPRIRAFFDHARAFRQALNAPDILTGSRVTDTMDNYLEPPGWTDDLNETMTYMAEFGSVMAHSFGHVFIINADAQEEIEGGQDPTDLQWKRDKLNHMKLALDDFIARDPDGAHLAPVAPAAGGKRRKTRKGKAKRSRRSRYSRRR